MMPLCEVGPQVSGAILQLVPACPRDDSQERLTLRAMLLLYADRFIQLMQDLRDLQFQGDRWKAAGVTARDITVAHGLLNQLRETCEALELHQACRQIDRMNSQEWRVDAYLQMLQELQRRIQDELESRVFFCVPADRMRFMGPLRDLFGQEVLDRFPSAAYDLEEAARCMVCGRYTAVAFHLLRAAEIGVRVFASGFMGSANPNWGVVLKACDEQLKKPTAAAWIANPDFHTDVTATLRAFKNAWRNPTMHMEKAYTEEGAREIWNALRALLQLLATRLSE